MTDVLPFLIWMLVPVVAMLRPIGRVAFVLAVCVAIAIEAIGAFCYTWANDIPIYAIVKGPHKMEAAWEWRNAPFVSSLRDGIAPAELLVETHGTFDAIQYGGRLTSTVTAGRSAVAAGWALVGHETPWQVGITIDGGKAIATHTFSERPDVRTTMGEAKPSGWLIPFSTTGLTPGDHRVAAFVWASKRAEGRYIGERTLTVRAPSLEDDFRTAASRIRDHQRAGGYWLTSHTTGTQFRQPQPEMNTYL